MSNENAKHALTCCFCGKAPKEDNVLIQGPLMNFICTDCINQIAGAKEQIANYTQQKEQEDKESKSARQSTPADIKKYLDTYIIEQDDAKKTLATAIYNHALRIKMKKEGVEGAENLEKSNIMMIGPTGVGKTAIVRHLAKALNVPFVIEDTTSFSSAGYVGRDVESMLRDLVDAAGGNIAAAEKGIIYIDEIDKCTRKGDSPSITADPTHESLQQALLKMLEGSVVEVSAKKGERHHPQAPSFKINTENILFIVGGAFEGIEKIIAKRQKKQDSVAIGFGSKVILDKNKAYNEYISDLRIEDLTKFGILPELLGRLPVICTLKPLTVESLIRILTEPKNALVKQYQTLFAGNAIDLQFSHEALVEIANKAIKRNMGARSLRAIIEDILQDVMFKAPGEIALEKVLVTVAENEIKIVKEYNEEKMKKVG